MDLKEITDYEYIKPMQVIGEERLKEFGMYDEVQERKNNGANGEK